MKCAYCSSTATWVVRIFEKLDPTTEYEDNSWNACGSCAKGLIEAMERKIYLRSGN